VVATVILLGWIAGALMWAPMSRLIGRVRAGGATLVSTPKPRMIVPEGLIDLGDGAPGEVLNGTFKIENGGSADLEFKCERSCGCTRLDPGRGTLAPGEAALIKVGVKLWEYSNSERAVRVTLKSNDLDNPSSQFLVVARSRASVDVSPSALSFGRLDPQEARTVSKTLTVRDRQGRPIRDPTSVDVRAGGDKLRFNWIKSPDGSYLLKVSLGGTLKFNSGDVLRDELSVSERGGSRPFVVPAYASIVDPVSLIPATVLLQSAKSAEGPKVVYVWVRSDAPLGHLLGIDGAKGITAEEFGELRPGLRRLKLVIGTVERPIESMMAIRFEKSGKPLMLRIYSSPSK